ncbi:amidophosphoribosyltransferase [Desulfatitalea alkaliphila]|uniref:Amidophosphoribosyltransferase n=1 Tax=Desulfatitalea alkaliphila TaxID=2929485 RepID=A0AA41R095_9BACT|nr:amidophosphoribosyltransferase [Desulfatitalea alkaliphila]MCJ8499717.1 amidophosphoribosyltransferase [Desulfatitalea alkaliphila]
MCAIAGLLFKKARPAHFPMTTGSALTEILDATLHRGPDSAGWALYRPPLEGELRMRFFIDANGDAQKEIAAVHTALEAQGATVLDGEVLGCTYGVRVGFAGDVLALTRAIERRVRLVSIGASLDIIKDVGQPYALAPRYAIHEFDGGHGIAHIRLATESGVHPDTAHPFWACGFADVATVHNGQLTNYWIMRRRLERRGMVFQTENDTELIAVYLAYRMSRGADLEEALRTSLEELDGTYSYLVATRDAIGYAKDKLAAKPMVKYEDEDLIAISSEEVGLNRLFPGRALATSEPAPLTYGLWRRAA